MAGQVEPAHSTCPAARPEIPRAAGQVERVPVPVKIPYLPCFRLQWHMPPSEPPFTSGGRAYKSAAARRHVSQQDRPMPRPLSVTDVHKTRAWLNPEPPGAPAVIATASPLMAQQECKQQAQGAWPARPRSRRQEATPP